MAGSAVHARMARRRNSSSWARISVDPDGLLESEDEPGADRLDDGRGAALLAGDRIVQVHVFGRVDVLHGAAAGDVRDPVGEQFAPDDQHAWRAGSADELVRAEEDRVLVGVRMPGRSGDP